MAARPGQNHEPVWCHDQPALLGCRQLRRSLLRHQRMVLLGLQGGDGQGVAGSHHGVDPGREGGRYGRLLLLLLLLSLQLLLLLLLLLDGSYLSQLELLSLQLRRCLLLGSRDGLGSGGITCGQLSKLLLLLLQSITFSWDN